jgi:hypothetical protein
MEVPMEMLQSILIILNEIKVTCLLKIWSTNCKSIVQSDLSANGREIFIILPLTTKNAQWKYQTILYPIIIGSPSLLTAAWARTIYCIPHILISVGGWNTWEVRIGKRQWYAHVKTLR